MLKHRNNFTTISFSIKILWHRPIITYLLQITSTYLQYVSYWFTPGRSIVPCLGQSTIRDDHLQSRMRQVIMDSCNILSSCFTHKFSLWIPHAHGDATSERNVGHKSSHCLQENYQEWTTEIHMFLSHVLSSLSTGKKSIHIELRHPHWMSPRLKGINRSGNGRRRTRR